MKKEQINELIIAVGAMTEMCALLRDNLIKNGFTRDEALGIVTAYVINTFCGDKEDTEQEV